MPFERIDNASHIKNVADKNIVFIYEQGQFLELFHFCQTLHKTPPKSFMLVTENAYAVTEQDKVNPYHTMAASFWKSFSQELNLAQNYLVDIKIGSNLMDALKQIWAASTKDKQFAVREQLYRLLIKRKKIPALQTRGELLFNPEACYLITGGTGELAAVLIEYLRLRGVKQIAITSSTPLSASVEAIKEKAHSQGVLIKHYQADAGNYQQMEMVIKDMVRTSPLKGVFHLAGVIKDGLVVNLTTEEVEKVLHAKMEGALILHQLTINLPLDMFVMFSSSASFLGAKGQANYAAANGFLDGLAHLRSQQGMPRTIAINWGPFADLGMTKKLTQGIRQQGFISLEKEDIDVLDVLLSSSWAQIAPCPMNWDIYCKYSPQRELQGLTSQPIKQNQHFLNALRDRSKEERVSILCKALSGITAQVLALDNPELISANTDLFSLGLDSLMALEIRNRIHDQLQCPALSLSIEYFINEPTVEKIALKIAEALDSHWQTTSSAPSSIVVEEKIALCDFQYIFWALNKRSQGFNIGMQLQIQGPLNKDYVVQAFELVIQQNATFWLDFNDDLPVQKYKKEGQFQLHYHDISLNYEAYDLNNEFIHNIRTHISLSLQPLIRVYLYKINNNLHELHLVIPHIIVDDSSCEIVFSEFKKNYAALFLGKPLVMDSKEGYLSYVRHNNQHHEKDLAAKIAFWQTYNKNFAMLNLGLKNHLPDAAKPEKHLLHFSIDRDLVENFITWHQSKNINVSTGLIAATQLVFYKLSHQNKIPIILIHNGREGSQFKSVVGLFSEYKRINITLNNEEKFMDCIHAIEEQLSTTAPFQKCSHFIKDQGLKGSRLSLSQKSTYWLNKALYRNRFTGSKLNKKISDYYLAYLSRIEATQKIIALKNKLNNLLNWNLRLLKPQRLRVLLSVTPSFFAKERESMSFANLNYHFPTHFGCMERPIGNRTLWVYFSRDQHGDYQLSINGPLTVACKEEIALELSQIMAKLLQHEALPIAQLINGDHPL